MFKKKGGYINQEYWQLFVEQEWYLKVAILTLVVVAFMLGINGGFILDDAGSIVKHPIQGDFAFDWFLTHRNLREWVDSRIFSYFTFFLNYKILGSSAIGFKVVNIFIHILNSWLLFQLVEIWLRIYNDDDVNSKKLALLVVALWAINPIHVSTVLYTTQRMTELSALFQILAMISYLKFRTNPFSILGLMKIILFSFLAVASKPSGLLLIPFFVLSEIFLAKDAAKLRIFLLVCMALTFACFVVLRWQLEGAYGSRSFDIDQRLLTETRVLVGYMVKILLPFHQWFSIFYDDIEISTGLMSPVTTWLSILIHGLLLLFAIYMTGKKRIVAFGILFFYTGHLIESTIWPLELVFEHRNYLASVGILFAVVLFLHWLFPMRKAFVFSICILVIFNYSNLMARSYSWGDPYRYALYEYKNRPESNRAAYQLSNVIFERLVNDGNISTERDVSTLTGLFDEMAARRDYPLLTRALVLCFVPNEKYEEEFAKSIQQSENILTFHRNLSGVVEFGRLVDGAVSMKCTLPEEILLSYYTNALKRSKSLKARVKMNRLMARYEYRVTQNYELAKAYMWNAVELEPNEVFHHLSYIKLLLANSEKKSAADYVKELEAKGFLDVNSLSMLKSEIAKNR